MRNNIIEIMPSIRKNNNCNFSANITGSLLSSDIKVASHGIFCDTCDVTLDGIGHRAHIVLSDLPRTSMARTGRARHTRLHRLMAPTFSPVCETRTHSPLELCCPSSNLGPGINCHLGVLQAPRCAPSLGYT